MLSLIVAGALLFLTRAAGASFMSLYTNVNPLMHPKFTHSIPESNPQFGIIPRSSVSVAGQSRFPQILQKYSHSHLHKPPHTMAK